MGNIVYGVCGEGLGHAARVMTIVSELKNQHRFLIFAARDAYGYLQKNLPQSDSIRIEPIAGLNFRYLFRRISYALSLASALPYVCSMSAHLREMKSKVREFDADLVLTDFEPLTARLARQMDLPLFSIDHQHFISELEFEKLPFGWQSRARLMGYFVNLHYDWQAKTIVSSFFNKCLASDDRVRHVGVSIRQELQMQAPCNEAFFLVYLRRFHSSRLITLLKNRSEHFVIYGRQAPRVEENLKFKAIDNFNFCRDLARCRGLISNAGNQLVGESLALGKPVLAIPESGNFEQQLNGYFLNQLGGGLSVSSRRVDSTTLSAFIDSLPRLRGQIDRDAVVGNSSMLGEIQSFYGLETPQPSPVPFNIPVSA